MGLSLIAAACSVLGASFGFADIQRLVAEHRIESVEGLLSHLPALYRSRYALVFESRSLQGASFENPRVILYGQDGKFLLSFNGDPRERGFDALEMAEFDESAQRFVFQELLFDAAGGSVARAAFSGVDPAQCRSCHGTPSRPIWDSHPSWPGVFGESYRETPSETERLGFEQFLRNQPDHPRYRHLADLDRFRYRYQFKPGVKEKYNALDVESPNAELSGLLSALNARTIAATVIRNPAFRRHRYAALASVSLACGDIDELFPETPQTALTEPYRQFALRTAAANQRELQAKRDRLQARSIPSRFAPTSIAEADALTKLRFVAEAGLGMDTAAWTLALEPGSYDFSAPRPLIREIESLLLNEVARDDPAVKALHVFESQTSNNRYCGHLWRRNRAAMAEPRRGSDPIP